MSRAVVLACLVALAAPAAARPGRVRDALCVSWSGPPLLALAPDVRTATDYANFLHDKEAAFGLFRWPPSATPDPKPAFTAAATLGRFLGPTRFVGDLRTELGLPPGAYALGFERSRNETVVVLWSTSAGMPLTLPARGRLRLVDMDGTERNAGGHGATLTLGPTPVYLIVQEGRP